VKIIAPKVTQEIFNEFIGSTNFYSFPGVPLKVAIPRWMLSIGEFHVFGSWRRT